MWWYTASLCILLYVIMIHIKRGFEQTEYPTVQAYFHFIIIDERLVFELPSKLKYITYHSFFACYYFISHYLRVLFHSFPFCIVEVGHPYQYTVYIILFSCIWTNLTYFRSHNNNYEVEVVLSSENNMNPIE